MSIPDGKHSVLVVVVSEDVCYFFFGIALGLYGLLCQSSAFFIQTISILAPSTKKAENKKSSFYPSPYQMYE